MVVDYNLPFHIIMESIIQATNADVILNKVKSMLLDENDNDEDIQEYRKIKDEFSVSTDGLILYGNKIIIPQSLQDSAI
jgi:hypothetical protein